jgi:hypothetical protein
MELTIILAAACTVMVLATAIQSIVIGIFLRRTPAIASEADLDRFRKLARTGMYLVFVGLPAVVVMIVCSVLIGARQGLVGLLRVLLANGVVLVFGLVGKRIEQRARSLKVESSELAGAYRAIAEAWGRKLVPDF